MIDRRKFLGITAAGTSLALTPHLLRALQQPGGSLFQQQEGKLIQRAIPSTGEMIPLVGLGFANHAFCADPAALKAVLKTFADKGGKVFDTKQGAPNAEQVHAKVAGELGLQNELFLSLNGEPSTQAGPQPPPDPAIVKAHIESLRTMFKVSRLHLVQLFSNADPRYWEVLATAKKAGQIRYIGAIAGTARPWEETESHLRNAPIDFISVDYAVDRRAAEAKILPFAQERKIAVMATRVFGAANGQSCAGGKGLFGRVGNTPVPEWAAEFDAKTWAQFFLKYVISHPAVTVARVGTTKPHHMLDNMSGGIGRLPDEATRKRMAQYIDGTPGATTPPPATVPAAVLDRYVGEYRTATGTIMTFRRQGAQLQLQEGTNPFAPLWPHSETRFGQGPVIEFQVDGAGAVTGLVLEFGNPVQKIPAARVR